MSTITVITAIEILFTVLSKTAELSALIRKARDEDRDITSEEWETLDMAQTEAHDKLKKSIEQREQEEKEV